MGSPREFANGAHGEAKLPGPLGQTLALGDNILPVGAEGDDGEDENRESDPEEGMGLNMRPIIAVLSMDLDGEYDDYKVCSHC